MKHLYKQQHGNLVAILPDSAEHDLYLRTCGFKLPEELWPDPALPTAEDLDKVAAEAQIKDKTSKRRKA